MEKQIKVALASPKIKLANPVYNAKICAESASEACNGGMDVIVFPELALTGSTCGDLFFQETLIETAFEALKIYIEQTRELDILSFIGMPLCIDSMLYNSVVALSRGKIIGVSASGETSRHFAPAPKGKNKITLFGSEVPFSQEVVYKEGGTRANIFVRIGDDSTALYSGVDIILNPAAMTEYVGLAEKRREFARSLSSSLGIPLAVVGAGEGESGTDGIYAAPRLVAANGEIIAESPLFTSDILFTKIDLKKQKNAGTYADFDDETVVSTPFVPTDAAKRAEVCDLALEIQARALSLRMERAYAKKAVIGVSGGLDSTLALLCAARAVDILGIDRKNIIAITMPCFGTTERTKGNALSLACELGCTVNTIDIKAAVNQHFADISHDEKDYSAVYENAQARERTQILMDIANSVGGLVVGTGDLSELALGFATYNGDHMSMYAVNASIPKTLMRAMISHFADKAEKDGNQKLSSVLTDVVNTPVSPELLPAQDGENAQHTEKIVGPYELHDFFLYYTVKYGYSPKKVYELAVSVFEDYESDDILKYLNVFVRRFFSQQFKRSCLPDGPRVTEISLSPRTAWQMPSDVSCETWLKSLDLKS